MFYNSLEELPNLMFAKSAKKKILLQQPLKLFIRSCFADFLFEYLLVSRPLLLPKKADRAF